MRRPGTPSTGERKTDRSFPFDPPEPWTALFEDRERKPTPVTAADIATVVLAELLGLAVGIALVAIGAGLSAPTNYDGNPNSGPARVIGWTLLVVSPLTALAGPAYGYWHVRRSRRWFILGAVVVLAGIPAVVLLARLATG